MVRKIIVSTLLVCLFIAVFLYSFGLRRVELGAPFLSLLKNTNRELNEFKIEIPDIPRIPTLNTNNAGEFILNVFIGFVNVFSMLVNIVSGFINGIISVFQFIIILIKNVITFTQNVRSDESSQVVSPHLISLYWL